VGLGLVRGIGSLKPRFGASSSQSFQFSVQGIGLRRGACDKLPAMEAAVTSLVLKESGGMRHFLDI
jgi:hypothetical protein